MPHRTGLADTTPLGLFNLDRVATWLAVLCYSVLFLLEIGIRNGELNQVFYLLDGLHRADPRFLQGDWYTTDTIHFHRWWSILIAALQRKGLLEFGLTAGTVLVALTFTATLYTGMRAIYDRPLLPWAMALLLFAGLFTRGLGSHELLPTSFEPFGVAGVALVVGLVGLAWQRPLLTGISWGFGALVHAHFAVLLSGVLLISTVLEAQDLDRSAMLKRWIPFTILAAPSLLQVLQAASYGHARDVFLVLSRVSPQHYFPWAFGWRPITLFIAAGLFGLGGLMTRPARSSRSLRAAIAAMGLIVAAGLALGEFDRFWFVNRAIPWRLTSVLILVGLVGGTAALADFGLGRGRRSGQHYLGMTLVWAALILFMVAGTGRLRLAVVVIAMVPAIGALAGSATFPTERRRGVRAMLPFAAVITGMLPIAYVETAQHSHLKLDGSVGDRRELYHWVQTATPLGSPFVVPPQWRDFRLNAQRPLVADWWAPPLFGADALEWDRRMRDLTGIARPTTLDQVDSAYRRLDCSRAEFLQHRYGVHYAVLLRGRTLPCGVIAYADARYLVFELKAPVNGY